MSQMTLVPGFVGAGHKWSSIMSSMYQYVELKEHLFSCFVVVAVNR